ncbi:hypothetical protein [Undibacterium fentianense]|uniref:Transmembrane protein n=1 Tax=Undibacterium fentianense TaxID=2828728 RepID=A0A941DYX8_9BURK|nr:hypothetical protein [Undibacterium fentianense]MBR7799325.1 hypothetical protein [Undibacterium fentianense]
MERIPNLHPLSVFLLENLLNYSYFALLTSIAFALMAAAIKYAPIKTLKKRRKFIARLRHNTRRKIRANLFLQVLSKFLHWLFITCFFIPLFAYDIIDRNIRALFRLNKEIDRQTFTRFESVIAKRLNVKWVELQNNDRFWLPFFILLSSNHAALKLIQSIRLASIFSRNQALACFIAAGFFAGAFRSQLPAVSGLLNKDHTISIAIVLFCMGCFFHWRFLQQYYSFTKLMIRAVATLDHTSKPSIERRNSTRRDWF